MTKRTLLLLHGAGDAGDCWAPFVARVRANGLADLVVETPDAPCHGGRRSEPGHTIALSDQLAEAIGHAERLAGGGPLLVGGHSMGAAVALGVAASRPDLVAGLWLEDPPLFTDAATDAALPADQLIDLTGARLWLESLQAQPLAQVIAGAQAEHPSWDPAEFEPWARAKQAADASAFGTAVPWVANGWAARAAEVRCPAVMAIGDPARGGLVCAGARTHLASLPGWSVHPLPVGHDVRRDAPEATSALLADLIRPIGS